MTLVRACNHILDVTVVWDVLRGNQEEMPAMTYTVQQILQACRCVWEFNGNRRQGVGK